MGLILDLGAPKAEELQPAEENNEISTFKSAMAGIGSGLFKIPCLLYTSPSPRDRQKSRMPSSA